MFALLKKDIIFTKKWIGISIVYAIVVALLIMHEGVTNIFATFFLIPFFVTSLPYTKIMSMEDNSDTRDFIRRLSVSKYVIVFSRVLFLLFLLMISSVSMIMIQVIGFHVEYNMDVVIKIVCVMLGFLAYFLIQLGVFYKYSYHAAQSVLVAISFLAIAVGFIAEKIDLAQFVNHIEWPIIAVILLVINGVAYFIDTKLYH